MSIKRPMEERFIKTIKFLKHTEPNCKTILDLGVENKLGQRLKDEGYTVYNTQGEDLDLNPQSITQYPKTDVVTAFQILEHMVSPFPVLRELPANSLVATVPLQLWFAKPYRNVKDKFDMHYHEFTDWQFDMLLEKAGWKITHKEKWMGPVGKIGIRPMLRRLYPRFYAVRAERVEPIK